MPRKEIHALTALCGIYMLRMLGLFLLLPVLALYVHDLPGATPTLIGLAVGAYGLTQALLQLPLSILSDRIGRKPVIAAGLTLFALGCVVAASSHSVIGVIIGRGLQGAGAISSAVMALLTDIIAEQRRVRAMAVVGMSIGIAFALGIILGPILASLLTVPGLFYAIGLLAVAAILVLYKKVPTPPQPVAQTIPFKRLLGDPELLRANGGILCLHALMTALFVSVPGLLRDQGLATAHHWYIYLPVLLLSFVLMLPLILIAEKKHKIKQVFLAAIVFIAAAMLWLACYHISLVSLAFGALLFFTGFNALEALLPSLIAKRAPREHKGAALGIYACFQFFGAFLGAMLAGVGLAYAGVAALFIGLFTVAGIWFGFASRMQPVVSAGGEPVTTN
jgi:MFS family permease